MSDDEKLFARVTVEVDVYIGTDPGRNDPGAYEMPYEYLVVREAEATGVTFHGNPAAGVLAEYSGADDFDADDALVDAVKGALIPAQQEPPRDLLVEVPEELREVAQA